MSVVALWWSGWSLEAFRAVMNKQDLTTDHNCHLQLHWSHLFEVKVHIVRPLFRRERPTACTGSGKAASVLVPGNASLGAPLPGCSTWGCWGSPWGHWGGTSDAPAFAVLFMETEWWIRHLGVMSPALLVFSEHLLNAWRVRTAHYTPSLYDLPPHQHLCQFASGPEAQSTSEASHTPSPPRLSMWRPWLLIGFPLPIFGHLLPDESSWDLKKEKKRERTFLLI